MWEEADGQIYLPEPDFGNQYVGVLYAGGAIIDGESAAPPSDVPIRFHLLVASAWVISP